MSNEAPETNPLALSDDDFMNLNGPTEAAVVEQPADEVVLAEPLPVVEGEESTAAVVDPALVEGAPVDDKVALPGATPEGETAPKGEPDPAGSAEGDKPAAVAEVIAPNFEEFYKQVMTPFKANGKLIELKTPDEAVKLMQMGANYTRKLQEMAPARKLMTMLQNNGLMDESKLDYLISLDKKDPEAIKKLLKESGIDPLEIDTSSEPAYLEGNHRVTDDEVNFRTALDDLGSTPEGAETLKIINSRWDQASKELLYKSPEALTMLHAQRETGIYDRIADEVDRQKTLGVLPAGTPFLQAYKIVGEQLTQANAFADLREKQQGNAAPVVVTPSGQEEKVIAPEPVATRAVAPKPLVQNGDAAGAASPTRAAPNKAEVYVNPLSMSDDEFLQQFSGRL